MEFNDIILVDKVKLYRGNRIVRFLLKMVETVDLNKIWELTGEGLFTNDELKEFYKMLGYTENGYEELFDK